MTIDEQTTEAAIKHAEAYAQGPSNGVIDDCEADFTAGAQWERQRDKWVSVKDELPPKPGYYIAMCISPYKEPGLIHFHPRTGWENGFYDASHWQPLPEPPKE